MKVRKKAVIDNIILDINKKIKAALTSYTVYNEGAPDEATFPYLTFEISNSTADAENTEIFYLDIDGWDNYAEANGTVRIETMMAYVATQLNKKIIVTTDASYRFILESRFGIRDPDLNIRRRKQKYQIKVIN
jgi:hypothetical protein